MDTALILGIGATVIAVIVGATLSKKAHPHIANGWRWVASHLAFAVVLYWGLNYFGVAQVDLYVKPIKVAYNR